MTKNRFTDEQVVRILQEAQVGEKTITDICRERGITKNTFSTYHRKPLAWAGLFVALETRSGQTDPWLERVNHRTTNELRKHKGSGHFNACISIARTRRGGLTRTIIAYWTS